MKKHKLVVIGLLFLAMILILSGCVARTDFEKLQANNLALVETVSNLENNYNALIIEYATLEDLVIGQKSQIAELSGRSSELAEGLKMAGEELEEVTGALSQATVEIESVMAELDIAEQQLSDIEKVYPLTGFNSVMQLEDWIRENSLNITTDTVAEWYRSALKIQEKGMGDGYLISVIYDEYDTDSDYGVIVNGAEVGGVLYVWDPETGELYYYTNFLTR